MILEEIIANKRREVAERWESVPLEEIKLRATAVSPPRDVTFNGAVSLIAELKRRSPSKGEFDTSIDPVTRARLYERGGAAAISVLTDREYFGGSLDDLEAVREAVSIPVLCKDFILSPYQVFEARARGADMILIVVAAIDDQTLVDLQRLSLDLKMTPLIEVHHQHDLARALAANARVIGINNRDLTDFSVDLLTTEYLAPLVPNDCTVVSESGITSLDDVQSRLR